MIKYILAVLISGFILSGCRHDHPGEAESKPKGPAPMTVLIYMAANNSMGLDRKDVDDIREMLTAAREGALAGGERVLVFRAEYGGKTQRLQELTPDSMRTIKVYADVDVPATDPVKLRQVIADSRDLAPAREYGLVLWSHSLGWTNSSTNPNKLRSFGQDKDTGREMTISELGAALDEDSFKFIYFDSCLMGSVEVVYELRHAAPYFGVSVTEVPYDGMPYQKTLPLLVDGSRSAMIVIANTVMEHYGTSTWRSCPVSAVVISSEGLDRLAAVTSEIYSEPDTLPADFTPQEFFYSSQHPEYRYYDLAEYVDTICSDKDLLDDWRDALSEVVVFNRHSDWVWNQFQILSHCGLSTKILFTPDDAYTLGYNHLQWYQDVASILNQNS